ncbi:hypothetical protein HUU40_15015 [candidate division KSB1 bacterium]|nr:hypothetical protein [candidate division KSB1 bacterium]
MSPLHKESTGNLIFVPALITLALTLLRLTGELLNWSPVFFNKSAGGGGALIGISWLVPFIGFYFAWRLHQAGTVPAGLGRLFGFAVLGLAVYAGVFMLALAVAKGNVWLVSTLGVVGAAAGLFVLRQAWPALFTSLFAYGLAARVPVVIIMFLAIMGNWGTHYDVAPPNFPAGMATFPKWVVIGLVPQLTFWMVYTVAIGLIFGGLAVLVAKRRPALA